MTAPPIDRPAAQSYRRPFAVVTTLFFMWGFLTSLNDILIPHLKAIFELNYARAMLIQFSFFSAYLFFSIPAGKVIEWIGYQHAMVFGLACMSAGAALFIPAANAASFGLFLAALIVLAGGITVLQVSANPYVSVLGPAATASSRLNLAQAVNSLGHTIAPYIGGLLILGAVKVESPAAGLTGDALEAFRSQQAASVKLPYLFLSLTLLTLAVLIAIAKLPRLRIEEHDEHTRWSDLLRHRNLVLGVIGIFLYVGAEVSIGSFLVNYLSQEHIGNMSERTAAGYVSFYWGAAMVGRFIGSAILQRWAAPRLLALAAAMASTLVITTMLSTGSVAVWSVLAVGFFNSVMFPSIFTIAIADLGPLTSKGSGALITAIVGGAAIPLLQGILADGFGLQPAFLLPAACYLYVVFYALQARHTVPEPVST